MLIKMTIDGAHHALAIVDGAVVFEAFLFRHFAHVIGTGIIGGGGDAGGFAETIFLARREEHNRKKQQGGTDKAFFHNFHFKYFIMRNLRGKDTTNF